jgi:4-hydroxy-2-oxoheptanedioate aldolase
VVRIPVGDTTLLKQYLDIGAQTILVPMVDTAEQAARLVQGMRYPPEGIRGMGSALARASRWQAYPNYLHEANAQTCLLVQAETVEAMKNIDAIAATPKAWTACSSARPTCRPRWASWASPTTPRCRR